MGSTPFDVSLNYPPKEAISEPMLAELFSPDIQNARSQISVCRSSFISQDFGFCGHSITLKFIHEGSMDMCKAKTEQATFHVLVMLYIQSILWRCRNVLSLNACLCVAILSTYVFFKVNSLLHPTSSKT